MKRLQHPAFTVILVCLVALAINKLAEQSGFEQQKLVHPHPAGKYTQYLLDGNHIREYATVHPELFAEPMPLIPIPEESE